MNDVVTSVLQKARAEFARSTTAVARETMMQVRQLDRVREIDPRFFIIFEAACLLRDNSTLAAINTLRDLSPLSEDEWAEIGKILSSAPENIYPAFTAVCNGLRNQLTPSVEVENTKNREETIDSQPQPDQTSSQSPLLLVATDELRRSIEAALLSDKSKLEIAAGLVQRGWTMESALRIIYEVKSSIAEHEPSPEERKRIKNTYAKHILFGLICVCVAGGATFWFYQTPSAFNYFWAFGAVAGCGVLDFFYGLFGWIKNSD